MDHKLFMYLTSSIIIKRHKHQIFWDQLARRAANNLLIKYKYSPFKHHTWICTGRCNSRKLLLSTTTKIADPKIFGVCVFLW
jgi:hypothetical protein